jgi:hypothetical protein
MSLMHSRLLLMAAALAAATALAPARAQFAGFVNHGLVGVGRLDGGAFDQLGAGVDTLGGIFSSMAVLPGSVQRTGAAGNYTWSGVLYGLPDRGFGDGATDFHPRIQTLDFMLTPEFGAGVFPQTQITLANTATTLLRDAAGGLFTGFNPDITGVSVPQTSAGGLGGGKRSLDPEGLVKLKNGDFFLSDEYGPLLGRYSASGELLAEFTVPDALLPKDQPPVPGNLNFSATNANESGRRGNRGLEGLSVSPDETRLFAMLQSPAIQDGGGGNPTRNTRLLVYDLEAGSPTQNQLIGEYVYQLTLNGNPAGNRHTPVSEILALNDQQLLILERDGLWGAAGYKNVNLADFSAATNLRDIAGLPYSLENGAPGQLDLPAGGTLPAGITPIARQDFISLLGAADLAKFGLNNSATPDGNTIYEKWEALALIPWDPLSFDNTDYLLLVGNDNDFRAADVYHNGQLVGSNPLGVDNMLLAYHVTLPGAQVQFVPEPSTWLGLCGLAAAVGGILRRRLARR